jgi:hypothetical protein
MSYRNEKGRAVMLGRIDLGGQKSYNMLTRALKSRRSFSGMHKTTAATGRWNDLMIPFLAFNCQAF